MNLAQSLMYNHSKNFFLLAGPCVVESKTGAFEIARILKEITGELEIPFVFKASYKKANRSSLESFTGVGDEKALNILGEIRAELGVSIVTDVHFPDEVASAAQVSDVLQIPAFLCRQTELLQAAADTGRIINIKKGQFMSPEAMTFAVEKVVRSGNDQVLVTERGVSFGYHELIVDMRSIPIMQKMGVPVVLDCTHANQRPNQSKGKTGGRPEFIETLARAGVAAGADGLFIETHPSPAKALSDGETMLPLSQIESVLRRLVRIKKAIQ